MDIECLLWLQKLRELTNDFFTPFMELISLFAISYLILIPVLIYWIVDKKKGLFPLASFYMCIGINVVVKLTACIYRPWIRDARVIPAGDAISTATGYSFPSGHVATSGPIYAGLVNLFGSHWGKFLGSGILVFFCIAAYPLIIKLLFNKEDKTEE